MLQTIFYFSILVFGCLVARFVILKLGSKIIPGEINGWKIPGVLALILQIIIASIAIKPLGDAFIKMLNKSSEVFVSFGNTEQIVRLVKVSPDVWAVISIAAALTLVKVVIENLPEAKKIPDTAIALVIIVVVLSFGDFLWEMILDKVLVEILSIFDRVFTDTTGGRVILDWVETPFPD